MGQRIDQLGDYGSYDIDKIKGDIIEVSKNSGTAISPIYASDGSRKMRLDDLATKLQLIADNLNLWSYIKKDGSVLWTGDDDHNGHNIKNVSLISGVSGSEIDITAATDFSEGWMSASSAYAVMGFNSEGQVKIDSSGISIFSVVSGKTISITTPGSISVASSASNLNLESTSGDINLISHGYTAKLPSSAPSANTYLKYDGTNYVWAAVSAGSYTLASLTDVNLTTPANGDLLKYDSGTSKWINFAPSYLTANQTITLSGDVSGSGSTSITTTIGVGKVTNSMLAGSIAYSKLSLTGSIINADISSSAAIAYSKLNLTGSILNADLAGSIDLTAKVTGVLPIANGGTNKSSYTSGSIVFYNGTSLTEDNSNLFYDSTNHRLGLGITSPSVVFHLAETSTSSFRGGSIDQYNAGTQGSRLFLRKSRGTAASPNTTIVSGDILGTILFSGNDGTQFLDMGGIRVTSVGTIGTNRVPTKMDLMTATDATTSVLTSALTIDQTQTITANSSTASTSTTTGALVVTGGVGIGGALYTGGSVVIGGNNASVLQIQNNGGIPVNALGSTVNNTLTLGGGFASLAVTPSIISLSALTNFSLNNNLTITGNSNTIDTLILAKSASINSTVSNTYTIIKNASTFNPTSGGAILHVIELLPTINQTSTANGEIILYNANPVLTSVKASVYGFRSQLAPPVAGGGTSWNIFADGSALSHFNHTVLIGGTTADSTGTKTLTMYNGTAPGAAVTNAFQLHSSSGRAMIYEDADRYIVQAANSTKTTASAPYTNDGYVTVVINGTTVKLMTTA